jgi:NADH-quinone oxidoreductase subunit E
MLLSAHAYQKIDRELSKFPADQKQSAIMASLAIAQEEKGWLPTEVIEDVAGYLGVPPITVQEVATFYNMFNTQPVGKHKIAVCTNLPCALRDGEKAGDYLKRKLGIRYGETTPDGMFTLVESECMGACGDSPVLIVNDKQMCVRMAEQKLEALLQQLKAQGDSA